MNMSTSTDKPEDPVVIAISTEDLRWSVLQLPPQDIITVDAEEFKGDMDALSGAIYKDIHPKAHTFQISRASRKFEVNPTCKSTYLNSLTYIFGSQKHYAMRPLF